MHFAPILALPFLSCLSTTRSADEAERLILATDSLASICDYGVDRVSIRLESCPEDGLPALVSLWEQVQSGESIQAIAMSTDAAQVGLELREYESNQATRLGDSAPLQIGYRRVCVRDGAVFEYAYPTRLASNRGDSYSFAAAQISGIILNHEPFNRSIEAAPQALSDIAPLLPLRAFAPASPDSSGDRFWRNVDWIAHESTASHVILSCSPTLHGSTLDASGAVNDTGDLEWLALESTIGPTLLTWYQYGPNEGANLIGIDSSLQLGLAAHHTDDPRPFDLHLNQLDSVSFDPTVKTMRLRVERGTQLLMKDNYGARRTYGEDDATWPPLIHSLAAAAFDWVEATEGASTEVGSIPTADPSRVPGDNGVTPEAAERRWIWLLLGFAALVAIGLSLKRS